MSEQRMRRKSENANVFRLTDRKATERSKRAAAKLVRIKVEVTCHHDFGETVQRTIGSELRARGYLVDDHDKPDWILSIVAFRHGDLAEMSIIFRRLFRTTTQGTEVDPVDSEEYVGLR